MSFGDARDAGVLKLDTADVGVPTVRNMVLAIDGVEADGKQLDTVVGELQTNGDEQATSTLVRFNGLGLLDELMHTVASPAMAYLFFIDRCVAADLRVLHRRRRCRRVGRRGAA